MQPNRTGAFWFPLLTGQCETSLIRAVKVIQTLAVVCSLLGFSSTIRAKDFSPEEAEVVRVIEAWNKAFDEGDYATLGRIIADDAVIHSTYLKGVFNSKKDFLDAYRKKKSVDKTLFRANVTTRTDMKFSIATNQADVIESLDVESRNPDSRRPSYVTLGRNMKLRKEYDGVWRIVYHKTDRL